MSAIPATTSAVEDLYTSSVTAKAAEKAVTNEKDMVSQEEFLKLLVTQLTNQDPLSRPITRSLFPNLLNSSLLTNRSRVTAIFLPWPTITTWAMPRP